MKDSLTTAVLKKQISKERLKWLCLAITAALLFGPFCFLRPVTGLGSQGHWALACIGFTLAAWIVYPERLPRGVAGVLMTGLLLAGKLPYGDVFYGYTTSAVWIIVPAFLFGHVIRETGLGHRITVSLLNRFKGSITGTAFALMVIGIIFSALTPSMTVRTAIVMPLVLVIIKTLNLKNRSRETAFITLSAYTAVIIPGNGWLTGSLVGPINMGFLPPGLRAGLDWFGYTRALILPWAIITVLMFFFLILIFRPHRFKNNLKYTELDLPAVSGQEISASIVLSLCFLGYLTTPLHGLEAAAITSLTLFLLFLTGTMDAKGISAGVNWEVVLFFGTIMSITRVLDSVGATAVLSAAIQPLVMKFAGNVTLFIYFILALSLAMRFIDVPWGLPSMAILFAFAPALAAAGIHPIVLCFINGIVQVFTFFSYMSPFAIMSGNLLEHKGWEEKHLVIYGLGFLAAVALAVLPAVWYWRFLCLL